MRQIVVVLHADDLHHSAAFLDLLGRHVAEADVPDQPLLLQLGQGRQRGLDRSLGWTMDGAREAQIDHLEHVQAQVAEVVVHRIGQVLG